jgi:hypothetical protein
VSVGQPRLETSAEADILRVWVQPAPLGSGQALQRQDAATRRCRALQRDCNGCTAESKPRGCPGLPRCRGGVGSLAAVPWSRRVARGHDGASASDNAGRRRACGLWTHWRRPATTGTGTTSGASEGGGARLRPTVQVIRLSQAPFLRPPVRPDGCFSSQPQANLVSVVPTASRSFSAASRSVESVVFGCHARLPCAIRPARTSRPRSTESDRHAGRPISFTAFGWVTRGPFRRGRRRGSAAG